jgi:CRP/FNR family transcriptional regulator, anaerobic regulatory protein
MTCTLPKDCAECGARDRAICARLSPTALDGLCRLGRTEVLRRGETLLWEGEEALVVGTVRSGLLKLTAALEDGREQILGLAFAGDFVGRPFAERSDHRITALADTTLCIFRRSAFEALAVAAPEIEHALLRRTFDELERARRWMLLLGRKSASERVASLLLEIAERTGAQGSGPIELPLSRQQMADVLGLTIETVSRNITRLKLGGALRMTSVHRYVIADPPRLAQLAGN